MGKTIETILALPFILAGLLWEFAVVGFRAGRMLHSIIKPK